MDRPIVVNSVLCFIQNYRETLAHDRLSAILSSNFSASALAIAVSTLLDLLPDAHPDHGTSPSQLIIGLYDRVIRTHAEHSPIFAAADLHNLPITSAADSEQLVCKDELLREIRELKRFIQDALNGKLDEQIGSTDRHVQTMFDEENHERQHEAQSMTLITTHLIDEGPSSRQASASSPSPSSPSPSSPPLSPPSSLHIGSQRTSSSAALTTTTCIVSTSSPGPLDVAATSLYTPSSMRSSSITAGTINKENEHCRAASHETIGSSDDCVVHTEAGDQCNKSAGLSPLVSAPRSPSVTSLTEAEAVLTEAEAALTAVVPGGGATANWDNLISSNSSSSSVADTSPRQQQQQQHMCNNGSFEFKSDCGQQAVTTVAGWPVSLGSSSGGGGLSTTGHGTGPLRRKRAACGTRLDEMVRKLVDRQKEKEHAMETSQSVSTIWHSQMAADSVAYINMLRNMTANLSSQTAVAAAAVAAASIFPNSNNVNSLDCTQNESMVEYGDNYEDVGNELLEKHSSDSSPSPSDSSNNIDEISYSAADLAEKPFTCQHANCHKRFANKFLLKKHQFIHTGLRPHCCPFCGKRFNRKDNLLRHKKTHLANALGSDMTSALSGDDFLLQLDAEKTLIRLDNEQEDEGDI